MSVALEKIQEKEQMLEDLLRQHTWAGVGMGRKKGRIEHNSEISEILSPQVRTVKYSIRILELR